MPPAQWPNRPLAAAGTPAWRGREVRFSTAGGVMQDVSFHAALD